MKLLGRYIASLLAASVAMLAAAVTRSMNIAVCLPFLLFCVSPFIGRALPFHKFLTLTSDQLTNIPQCVKSPNVYQTFGILLQIFSCDRAGISSRNYLVRNVPCDNAPRSNNNV